MKLSKVNRRKHQRVKVKAGAIVAFKKPRFFNFIKPRLIRMGPIIDISRGGLAVQYIENSNRLKNFKKLSILSTDGEVMFEDMPFKTILDEKITELPDSKVIRKRAIQFNELKGSQIVQLENFIRNLDIGVMFFRDIKDYTENSPITKEIEGKTKFDIQSDILKQFKTIKAKAGYVLTPGWLLKKYTPSLTAIEKKLLEGAIDELTIQGLIEYIKDPEPNYRLTQKGEAIIYK